jgi:dolichol kinase
MITMKYSRFLDKMKTWDGKPAMFIKDVYIYIYVLGFIDYKDLYIRTKGSLDWLVPL